MPIYSASIMSPLVWSIVFMLALCGITESRLDAQVSNEAEAPRISTIQGELYRVDAGARVTVFLATSDGIVIADPLDRDVASWLKTELAVRFPGRAVRYVLQTHHAFDRSEGGAIFAAELVGHRAFNSEVSRARRSPLPAPLATLDQNHDGKLQAAEAAGSRYAGIVVQRDRDGDGALTVDELYGRTQNVTTTFERSWNVSLGGSSIELIHPDVTDTPEMTAVYFPNQRVVFVDDAPVPTTTPFRVRTAGTRSATAWLHAVTRLDFDVALTGQGEVLRRADLVILSQYLDELIAAVAQGSERGLTPAEIERTPSVERLRDNVHFAERAQQIAALSRSLHVASVDLQVAGLADYRRATDGFCSEATACVAGGIVLLGTQGLGVSFGRFGASVEGAWGGQTLASRTSALRDAEFANRQTSVSVFFRVRPNPRGPIGFRLLAGPAFVSNHSLGFTRVRAFAPAGGRHALEARSTSFGFAGGIDLTIPVNGRVTLVFPVRAMQVFGTPVDTWPATFDLHMGVGLSLRLARRIVQ